MIYHRNQRRTKHLTWRCKVGFLHKYYWFECFFMNCRWEFLRKGWEKTLHKKKNPIFPQINWCHVIKSLVPFWRALSWTPSLLSKIFSFLFSFGKLKFILQRQRRKEKLPCMTRQSFHSWVTLTKWNIAEVLRRKCDGTVVTDADWSWCCGC